MIIADEKTRTERQLSDPGPIDAVPEGVFRKEYDELSGGSNIGPGGLLGVQVCRRGNLEFSLIGEAILNYPKTEGEHAISQ